MNISYNIITEEKKKLERQLDSSRVELGMSYLKGLDIYSNIKNVDLNRLSPMERLVFKESMNKYKIQLFKLKVFNVFINSIISKNMLPIDSFNPEFKNFQDLVINCDTFIEDENKEYTRSVINIGGFFFDCSQKMNIEEYINIYISMFKKLLIEQFGIEYENEVLKIYLNIMNDNNQRTRK